MKRNNNIQTITDKPLGSASRTSSIPASQSSNGGVTTPKQANFTASVALTDPGKLKMKKSDSMSSSGSKK
jgi:hypothetical protein